MNKKFIKATNERCSFEKYVSAPYMRKKFNIDFEAEKAKILICGLGFYRLFINGCEITKGHIAPYISNPDHYCYYDEYDVTSYLRSGENVVGIILGNGFYNNFSGVVLDFDKADWCAPPCAALEFTAESGENRLEFTADTSFKVHPSPIYFDDYRMGEYYDANNEVISWCEPGFDDSDWNNALWAEIPRGEMRLCRAEPIKVLREIKPVKITKCKNGYIYDFGVNTAGVCRLKVKGGKKYKIVLRHGEMIEEDGELRMANIGFDRPNTQFYKEYNQKDIFISNGKDCEYVPSFTYHGFRYVEVCGIDEELATEDLLTYLEMSSGFKTLAKFECSEDIVNKIYEIAVRSDRSNFFYFPTDCPHREKNGWTGDASASAEHMALMYDVSASFREWLNNIRKVQKDTGELPGIVPTGGWGYEWGNGPAWDSVQFNLPYVLYKYRGDLEVIRENSAAMVRYLEYIMGKRNADGTVSIGLGDWAQSDRDMDSCKAPLAVTDSVMVMDMARKAAEMFGKVGYEHQKKFAEGIYADMRKTIRDNLIDLESGTVLGECQTSQALCLYYGVFEENEEEKAFERLLEYIHECNDSFDCGFLGMHTIFHVLSDFGYGELAYYMITKPEHPSYANLVNTGETSLLEHIILDRTMISHNHHFMGDVSRWFINRIAGLCVINSELVEIKPDFIKAVDWASASVELPGGNVSVKWKRENGVIRLCVKTGGSVGIKIVKSEKLEEKVIVEY